MSGPFVLRARALLPATGSGAVPDAAIAVERGSIAFVGRWGDLPADLRRWPVVDAGDKVVTPGLVDSHTHLLEFGGGTAWGVGEPAQHAAAGALALDALRGGVTALGEHVVGHFAFARRVDDYVEMARTLPQTVRLSVGTCVVGTDPLTCLCAVRGPGAVPFAELVDDGTLAELASLNEFPGENLMLTATPANLPTELAPLSGRLMYGDELGRVVSAYHAAGRRIGAHLEGDEAAERFIAAGGDAIHHGHGLTEGMWPRLAEHGVVLCATPGGGTGRAPNTADEIAAAVRAGVEVAIATDAVLPLHPAADASLVADGTTIHPGDLLSIAAPTLRRLCGDGVSPDAAIALITRNPARLLGLDERIGTVAAGRQADLVVWHGVPGLDVGDRTGVAAVVIGGRRALGELDLPG